MRTALFYSCKGGSGRTLSLANIAWQLVRLGLTVLCVDLDLEAPGIPEALGQDLVESGQRTTGFLEYALRRLGDRPVEDASNPLNAIPVDGTKLRVIRAGDYSTGQGFVDYVRVMRKGRLEGIYTPPASQGTPSPALQKLADAYDKFWEELRTALAGYKPDYLLIDTRTGFSPLSATTVEEFFAQGQGAISDSLDLLVFTEQGSEASRRGTQVFLRELWERGQTSAFQPRLTIVRRETPLMKRVTDAEAPKESIAEWLVAGDEHPWNNIIASDSCWPLSSDPRVERTGMNLSAPGGDLPHRVLVDDYVRLTARLIREDLATTRERLGLPADETPSDFRLFELPSDGGMQNVADSQPNISFTVDTFHRLVSALVEARSTTDAPLVRLGRDAGETYADKLLTQSHGDRVVAFEEWLHIDSSVGWGQFGLVPPRTYDFIAALQRAATHRPLDEERENPPHVVVKHNVFAPSNGMENLCCFLGAYITGIVSRLTGTDMKPTEHAVCQSKKSTHCEFGFSPRTTGSGAR